MLGSQGARKRCGLENEPLFYGKELKALELELILYDFKVCILSEPDLTGCERWLLGLWGRQRGDKTSTAGPGGRGFDLWGPVGRRGRGEGAGGTDCGEEETVD